MKNQKNNLVGRQAKNLGMLLGMSSFDGAIALAALSGLFRIENAVTIAIVFIAGPAAILTASFLQGNIWERMISAIIAGLFATVMVTLAAAVGPNLLSLLNLRVVKIFGGIAIMIIALMVSGIKIPSFVPLIVMITGIVGGIICR